MTSDLTLLTELVNTVDLQRPVDDQLADAPSVARWLVAHGLLDADDQLDDEHADAVVVVREAVRALARFHAGEDLDSAALDRLDGIAAGAPLRLEFDGESVTLRPAVGGGAGAVARLLAALYEAALADDWERFKACQKESCQWAFVDRSRNRSRRWCDMAQCGNVMKARSFRARQRDGDSG